MTEFSGFRRAVRMLAIYRAAAWLYHHGPEGLQSPLTDVEFDGIEMALLMPKTLGHAVQLTDESGALVVAAVRNDGHPVWPGALAGVIGVEAVWDGARDALCVEARPDGGLLLRASAFPRPIPGVPTERNLQGVSFAVANATGFLARFCETSPSDATVTRLRGVLLRG